MQKFFDFRQKQWRKMRQYDCRRRQRLPSESLTKYMITATWIKRQRYQSRRYDLADKSQRGYQKPPWIRFFGYMA